MKTFTGDFIRYHRRVRGLTQRQLADKFEIHCQFFSNMERGVCGIPVDYVAKLCRVLDLDEDDRTELACAILKDWSKPLMVEINRAGGADESVLLPRHS